MGRDLRAAATIVELELAVDVTAGIVDLDVTSCRPAVTQDCVAQRLRANSVSCPQMRSGEKKSAD